MGSLETFSYKERLKGDFSFYDNCVDEVSINGQTEQTGKISYLVDFSCSLIADNDIKKNDEIINNKIVSDSKVQESNESLASHCSELYGCQSVDAQEQIINENSRINSHNERSYAGSKLNNVSSDGKFANLNPEQKAFCLDKLKRGKIKLERSSNLYYEMENLPLQGLQKKYVCNNDGSQGLAMFNAFTGAVAGNQNANQNYNQNASPSQPFL